MRCITGGLSDEMVDTYTRRLKARESARAKDKSTQKTEVVVDREELGGQPDLEEHTPDLLEDMVARQEINERENGRNWTKYIPNVLLSNYSRVDKVNSLSARAFNGLFFENPQVNSGGTVSIWRSIYDGQIRKAGASAMDNAYPLYLAENKMQLVKGVFDVKSRTAFNEQVARAVKGLDGDDAISDSIKMARDGVRAQFAKALEVRKANGEVGFTKVISNSNYFPDLLHKEKTISLMKANSWKQEDFVDLFTKGYMAGGKGDMVESQARLVAHIKYDGMRRGVLVSDERVSQAFQARDETSLQSLLAEMKIPQEDINAFIAKIKNGDDWKSISNRAKNSLKIDWETGHTVKGKELKVGDFMNTNTDQVLEAYTKEASFGAGMAKMGIKSEAGLRRLSAQWQKAAVDEGDTLSDVQFSADVFGEGIKLLRGESLIDYTKIGNRNMRRIRDATSMLMLQEVGFASLPELARGTTQLGIVAMLNGVPDSGMFKMARGGRNSDFTHEMTRMEDLEQILGFVDSDNLASSRWVQSDEWGSADEGFYRLIDTALAQGRQVQSYTSGFHHIQGGVSKATRNALDMTLIRGALGEATLDVSQRNQLRMAGMTDGMWDSISEWVKKNHGTGLASPDSSRLVKTWNFKAMEQPMQDAFLTTMNRLHNRTVQKGMIGEDNSMWLGGIGSFLTQFRSFSLRSLEKQLIADMRGDTVMASVKNFTWGLGLSYGAYMAQMNLRAIGMSDDKADAYLEEHTTGSALWLGVYNKHSMLAGTSPLIEMGAALGMTPNEYTTSRTGYNVGNLSALVPALGAIEKMAKIPIAGFGAIDPTATQAERDQQLINLQRNSIKMIPLADTVLAGEYLKNITGLERD